MMITPTAVDNSYYWLFIIYSQKPPIPSSKNMWNYLSYISSLPSATWILSQAQRWNIITLQGFHSESEQIKTNVYGVMVINIEWISKHE